MAVNYGSKRTVVGAHYGLRDWLVQRATGALMAVFTCGPWWKVTTLHSAATCSPKNTSPSYRGPTCRAKSRVSIRAQAGCAWRWWPHWPNA